MPPAASPNSLRRLADGAAATAWKVTTTYSDDECTNYIMTLVESYGQCLIDYASGVAQSTSYVTTATVGSDGSATTSKQAYSDNTCTVKNGNPTSGTIPAVTTCTQAGLYYAKISTTSTNPTPGFSGALVTSYFGSSGTCTAKTPVTEAQSVPWGAGIPILTASAMYTHESSTQSHSQSRFV